MVTKIIVRIPLEVKGRGRASASNSNRGGDAQNSKKGDGDDNSMTAKRVTRREISFAAQKLSK